MPKNQLITYDAIKNMLLTLKMEKGEEVRLDTIKNISARTFNIIDYVAMRRFMVSLDKLGFIKPSPKPEFVMICI